MVLGEAGLLSAREKKRQAVGPFRVTLGCLMADAISMAIKSHDHSISKTLQGHKPIRAGKRRATLWKIKSRHKAGSIVYGGEGKIDSFAVASGELAPTCRAPRALAPAPQAPLSCLGTKLLLSKLGRREFCFG